MSKTRRMDGQESVRQFWSGHVQKHRRSRISAARYCRENKLKLSTFRYWARKLKPVDTHGQSNQGMLMNHSDLVEVTRILSPQDRKPISVPPFLEIELGQECRVRIPPHWEADDLKKILGLIREWLC